MNFKEYCTKLVNLEFSERVRLGQEALSQINEALGKKGTPKEEIEEFVNSLIRAGVSGDLSCDGDEYKLYDAVFGNAIPYEDFYEITNGGVNKQFVNELDALVDSLDPQTKFASITLVGIFLAADDKLTPKEQSLLAKLLA